MAPLPTQVDHSAGGILMTEFIDKVDHVAISVDDLRNSERFLIEVLGFQHVQTIDVPEPGNDRCILCSRCAVVELMYLHDADQRRDRLGSAVAVIDHIGFEVGDAPAVADSLRRLRCPVSPRRPLHKREAPTRKSNPRSHRRRPCFSPSPIPRPASSFSSSRKSRHPSNEFTEVNLVSAGRGVGRTPTTPGRRGTRSPAGASAR